MEEPVVFDGSAVGAERKFTTSAHGGKEGALSGGGEAGRGAVERGNGGVDRGVAGWVVGVERAPGRTGFERERALAGRGGELVKGEALVDGVGAAESVEAGAGEDQGVAGAFFKFAQAGVDVAAELDELEIGAQGQELGATTRAGGAHAAGVREGVERPVRLADEGVAGVGARRDGGEREAGVELSRQVFKGVDGEVDASSGERFFDLLDEDAFAVKAGRRLESGLLHAVAGGANDLNFDFVAVFAQRVCDVVGLPEGELRTTRSDSDVRHHLNRIRHRGKRSVTAQGAGRPRRGSRRSRRRPWRGQRAGAVHWR